LEVTLLRFYNFVFAASVFLLNPLNTSASCITLSWTATGDDGYTGVAKQYDIRYSLEYLTEANWNSAPQARCPLSPKPAGQRETLIVGDLQGGQTYYFALKVADERNNWSAMSNVVARVAPPDVCIGVVGNANCSDDDDVTIGDLSQIVGYLFQEGIICCTKEADTDGNGLITIGDISRIIDHLFINQILLANCD